jgi:hypothetical protein
LEKPALRLVYRRPHSHVFLFPLPKVVFICLIILKVLV